MAATLEGAALTEAHRLAMARLGQRATLDLLQAWTLLDPFALDATVARWLDATLPIVQAHHSLAADAAERYYRRFRTLEAPAATGVALEGLAPAETVRDVLSLARVRRDLMVTGPVAIKAGAARGLSTDDLIRTARQASAGAGMRHAVQGGRGTVMRSMQRDPLALGYARTASGSACSFCAMLASRGPVYDKSTVHFRSHGHCTCGSEPVYTRQGDWPDRSRAWEAQWQMAKATAAEAGVSTSVQFRRLHEGRA